jgi:hypothetical protein
VRERPTWAEARPRFANDVLSADAPFEVFAVGREIFVARRDGDRFRIARLENDALIEEDAWSGGLPVAERSHGRNAFFCSRLGAIFGRFPDSLWLVENSGGSMECGSTFGEYRIWRHRDGSWSHDDAHSPPQGTMVGGELATWPLSRAVLGFGVSNLVGDTLTAPVEAMWVEAANPWATGGRLAEEGWSVMSACASASGSVAALAMNENHVALTTLERDGSRAAIELPPGHLPEGPCAIDENEIVVVEPHAESKKNETWWLFDRKASAWSPVSVPWPHRTEHLDFAGARVVAVTRGSDGRAHLFSGTRTGASWSEIAGVSGAKIEIVAIRDDGELLLHIDDRKLVRAGLPRD